MRKERRQGKHTEPGGWRAGCGRLRQEWRAERLDLMGPPPPPPYSAPSPQDDAQSPWLGRQVLAKFTARARFTPPASGMLWNPGNTNCSLLLGKHLLVVQALPPHGPAQATPRCPRNLEQSGLGESTAGCFRAAGGAEWEKPSCATGRKELWSQAALGLNLRAFAH